MVLVGSLALGHHGCGAPRPPKDVDVICSMDEFKPWYDYNKSIIAQCYPLNEKKYIVHTKNRTHIEFEIAWSGSSGEDFIWLVNDDPESFTFDGIVTGNDDYLFKDNIVMNVAIPSIEALYMLKMSHRYLKNSPHFLKTMKDIKWLRERFEPTGRYDEWLKKREKETYTYKHPSLMQSKKNFFDASVKYVYDHDSIHRAVALLEKPAYEYYKSDNAEVFCDKNKFFAASDAVRLYGVYEEACVLALERSQIPFGERVTPERSFEMALMKVCTSITSGFFREYAWEHYDEVMELYNTRGKDDYVKLFKEGIEIGIVKKLEEQVNG